jgi:chaperonin GroES
MKIEPLGARVLVRPIEGEQTFAGGELVLPDTARQKPQKGVIEAIGDPEEMMTDLVVEDQVIFPSSAGTAVQVEGSEYLLIDEADILARIRR